MSDATRIRTEAEMSASGLTWSARLHGWVTDEEAEAEGELAEVERKSDGSNETAVMNGNGGAGKAGAGEEGGEKSGMQGGAPMGRKLTVAEQMEADGVIWAEWDGPEDPANPFNWGVGKKWMTTSIVCFFTAAVAYSGSCLPMGNASMIAELRCSEELATMALSAFPLGFGVGPLVLAPFSEAYGRYYVYCVSSFFYLVFLVPIARAENIATVIVCRLIAGIAGSTGSTLVGGSIADMFDSSVRGTPMGVFSMCAFIGTALGPLCSGFVEDAWGWRGIEYVQLVMAGVLTVCVTLLTRETRGASLAILIKNSMTRPVYLLFTEATVASFSLFIGFSWGVLYLCLEAVPLVMQNVYGFSAGQSGAVFASVVIAALLGGLTNLYQERLYARHVATRGPEARLYACMLGGLLFPSGIMIFAFSQGRGHWIGPCIGLVVCFTGIYTMYLATFSYLADCYQIYASSALSGQSLCRNLAGTAFPLFTRQMYGRLGYQWASFLAGCLGFVISVVPFILFAYGPKIRASSRFAKELAVMQGK